MACSSQGRPSSQSSTGLDWDNSIYKQGKRLSEAVAIMASMRDAGHIDPALFALFLESGVYRDYAQRFMQPACIDEVDVAAILAKAA